MATVEITCPNCAWDDKIDESLLGRKVKCGKCGHSFEAESGGHYDLADHRPGDVVPPTRTQSEAEAEPQQTGSQPGGAVHGATSPVNAARRRRTSGVRSSCGYSAR